MGHDCDYTDLRESLVPEAEKYADDHVGARPQMLKVPGGVSNYAYEAWVKAWNQCFLAHIDAEMKAMLARQETL